MTTALLQLKMTLEKAARDQELMMKSLTGMEVAVASCSTHYH